MTLEQRKAFWNKRKGNNQRFVGQADSFKMLDKALKANGERCVLHSHGDDTHLLRYNEYDYEVYQKLSGPVTLHHFPDYRQNFSHKYKRAS